MKVSFVLKVYFSEQDVHRKTINIASFEEFTLDQLRHLIHRLQPKAELAKATFKWQDAEGLIILGNDDDLDEALHNLHRMADGKDVLRIHVLGAVFVDSSAESACSNVAEAAHDIADEPLQELNSAIEVASHNMVAAATEKPAEAPKIGQVQSEAVRPVDVSSNPGSLLEAEALDNLLPKEIGQVQSGAAHSVVNPADPMTMLKVEAIADAPSELCHVQTEPVGVISIANSDDFALKEELKEEHFGDVLEKVPADDGKSEGSHSTDYLRRPEVAVLQRQASQSQAVATCYNNNAKASPPKRKTDGACASSDRTGSLSTASKAASGTSAAETRSKKKRTLRAGNSGLSGCAKRAASKHSSSSTNAQAEVARVASKEAICQFQGSDGSRRGKQAQARPAKKGRRGKNAIQAEKASIKQDKITVRSCHRSKSEVCFKKEPFKRAVSDAMRKAETQLRVRPRRITTTARLCLQEVTENVFGSLFQDAFIITKHAKRVTLMVDDLRMVRRLQRHKFDCAFWSCDR